MIIVMTLLLVLVFWLIHIHVQYMYAACTFVKGQYGLNVAEYLAVVFFWYQVQPQHGVEEDLPAEENTKYCLFRGTHSVYNGGCSVPFFLYTCNFLVSTLTSPSDFMMHTHSPSSLYPTTFPILVPRPRPALHCFQYLHVLHATENGVGLGTRLIRQPNPHARTCMYCTYIDNHLQIFNHLSFGLEDGVNCLQQKGSTCKHVVLGKQIHMKPKSMELDQVLLLTESWGQYIVCYVLTSCRFISSLEYFSTMAGPTASTQVWRREVIRFAE